MPTIVKLAIPGIIRWLIYLILFWTPKEGYMAYIYEVSFDIRSNQLSQLDIGAPLERVVGYLRTLLPSEPGYVTSRAMYLFDVPDKTNLVIQSVWETWEDLQNHKNPSLAEQKTLSEFAPHINNDALNVRVYQEITLAKWLRMTAQGV